MTGIGKVHLVEVVPTLGLKEKKIDGETDTILDLENGYPMH